MARAGAARNVKAVVVVRPPLAQDSAQRECLHASPLGDGSYAVSLDALAGKEANFTFPAAYGHGAQPPEALCPTEIEPLLQGCFAGESACVLAYGHTGAGKSYTMGTEAHGARWEGSVGAFVSRRIFEMAAERGLAAVVVECGMVEIYKEGSNKELVYDCLQGLVRCKLGRQYSEQTYPWHRLSSPDELMDHLAQGSANRNTDRTDGNARSSRSHAIFTVRVQHTGIGADGRQQLVRGRLLLVDLAGAENASAAEAGSVAQKQGAGINVGLGTLQQVIADVAKTGKSAKYRDSNLTYLLKPALGGLGENGCNAVFIGCVSPLTLHRDRTLKTLQYTLQAGSIRNTVTANVESLEARREEALRRERDQLKAQVGRLAVELEALRAAALGAAATGQGTQGSAGFSGISAAAAAGAGDAATEVVVVSVEEHRRLVQEAQQQRDRADALDALLQGAEKRHSELQRTAHCPAAASPGAATPPAASVGALLTPGLQPTQEHADQPQSAAVSLPPPSPAGVARRPTPAGISPALAALAASPVMAAARSVAADAALSAAGADDTGAYLELLAVEDVCLPADQSNLEQAQLSVLQRYVQRRLQEAAEASTKLLDASTAAGGGGGGGGTAASGEYSLTLSPTEGALRAALRLRTGEVAALRLAVRSYNECMGELVEQLVSANDMVTLAALEKVRYVQLSAAYEESLSQSQHDVRVLAAREQARGRPTPSAAHTPGGGILQRVGLRALTHGSPATGDRRGEITPKSSAVPTHPADKGSVSPLSSTSTSPPSGKMAAIGAMLHRFTGAAAAPPPAGTSPVPQPLLAAAATPRPPPASGADAAGQSGQLSSRPTTPAGPSSSSNTAAAAAAAAVELGADGGHVLPDDNGDFDVDMESPGVIEMTQDEEGHPSPLTLTDREDTPDQIPSVGAVPQTTRAGGVLRLQEADPHAVAVVEAEQETAAASAATAAVHDSGQAQTVEGLKALQGGVDVSAISTTRFGQVSEAFLASNAHWQPGRPPAAGAGGHSRSRSRPR